MRRPCVMIVVAALAGCHQPRPSAAPAPKIEAIAIDDGAAGYTVLTGVPAGDAGLPIRRAAAHAGARVVAWAEVVATPLPFLGGAIQRDEYGLRARLEEVAVLISQRPGQPIAITWDGGLADSDALRQLAVRRMIAESAWPDGPRVARGGASDPLDPAHLLAAR